MSEAYNQEDVLKLGQLISIQNDSMRDLIVKIIELKGAVRQLETRVDHMDSRVADLTTALNTNARQTRAVLQNAAKAPSKSQELDVRGLATPVPPKPYRR